jgi:hypothetical protein
MLTTLLIVAICVEVGFKPRIDVGKNVFLWYGRKDRKYFRLL